MKVGDEVIASPPYGPFKGKHGKIIAELPTINGEPAWFKIKFDGTGEELVAHPNWVVKEK
jgi:hypothetical protein